MSQEADILEKHKISLILKTEYREELRKPLGKLIKDISKLKKYKDVVTVGDKTTQTFLDFGIIPRLSIVDYRIERNKITYKYRQKFKEVKKSKNRRGTISYEAIEIIDQSLKCNNCLIEIDGEEDLLVLPVILKLNKGVACYGQPKEGIVLVKINREIKERVTNMLIKYFNQV
ncbi:MAG: hypothetical protein B6U88_00070 [Candidatus Aenigmarchaeota archaeon ex4484_56]|nr:MAG: hypothetical protein B6U88_00070 [Candidatus Aenigmarchaeota archaeon ex4484_56]